MSQPSPDDVWKAISFSGSPFKAAHFQRFSFGFHRIVCVSAQVSRTCIMYFNFFCPQFNEVKSIQDTRSSLPHPTHNTNIRKLPHVRGIWCPGTSLTESTSRPGNTLMWKRRGPLVRRGGRGRAPPWSGYRIYGVPVDMERIACVVSGLDHPCAAPARCLNVLE